MNLTWNFRVVKDTFISDNHSQTYFSVCGVYYDEHGNIAYVDDLPVFGTFKSIDEMRLNLLRCLDSLEKSIITDEKKTVDATSLINAIYSENVFATGNE